MRRKRKQNGADKSMAETRPPVELDANQDSVRHELPSNMEVKELPTPMEAR